jgi:predicted DNA-binding protein
MSRAQINIRLTIYEKRKLAELAAQSNKTISDLLREALNEVIADFHDGPAVLKPRSHQSV